MSPSRAEFKVPIPLDYVEATIPPGMTVAEYQRSRPRHESRRRRLRRRARAD